MRITSAGAQDTVAKSLFEPRDLLVIDGGTHDGVALGQKYFIGARCLPAHTASIHKRWLTLGWLTVVAVNDTTAIGSFDHFCGGVTNGDFLVPYAPPSLPADAERDE